MVCYCRTKHTDIGKVLDRHHYRFGNTERSSTALGADLNQVDTVENCSDDAMVTVHPNTWGWIYAADMIVTNVTVTDVTLEEVSTCSS